MAEANYSLSPAARLKSAVFTRALYRAKDAVKRQLQAQGHKVAHYSSRDITILAQAYLDQHREELLPEAMQTVERWAAEGFFGKRVQRACAELRTFVQSQEPCSDKTISVHKSCSERRADQ
jgi:hypothetical protein